MRISCVDTNSPSCEYSLRGRHCTFSPWIFPVFPGGGRPVMDGSCLATRGGAEEMARKLHRGRDRTDKEDWEGYDLNRCDLWSRRLRECSSIGEQNDAAKKTERDLCLPFHIFNGDELPFSYATSEKDMIWRLVRYTSRNRKKDQSLSQIIISPRIFTNPFRLILCPRNSETWDCKN